MMDDEARHPRSTRSSDHAQRDQAVVRQAGQRACTVEFTKRKRIVGHAETPTLARLVNTDPEGYLYPIGARSVVEESKISLG